MTGFEPYFRALSGSWKLEKSMSDGTRFLGHADFTSIASDQIRVSEGGHLKFADGREFSANRSWVWHFKQPDALTIYYDESPLRLYHHLALAHEEIWLGEASHLCGKDTYCGKYRFFENYVEVEQFVTGPNKDYQIISTYSP